jgi:ubiquinone/menaquinone biosynthesis C-methylase UbiE
MRIATRRAAGLEGVGWTPQLQQDVRTFFDDIADQWHTRVSAERTAVVEDALQRGFDKVRNTRHGVIAEIGSGIGTYSALLAKRADLVLAIDLSLQMLVRAPRRPAHRVLADASRLPLRDRSVSAVALINAFVFPPEVERVLADDGALLWINISGEQTPIYLSVDDLRRALPGRWRGVASRAGEGSWCVLRRE